MISSVKSQYSTSAQSFVRNEKTLNLLKKSFLNYSTTIRCLIIDELRFLNDEKIIKNIKGKGLPEPSSKYSIRICKTCGHVKEI